MVLPSRHSAPGAIRLAALLTYQRLASSRERQGEVRTIVYTLVATSAGGRAL